MAAISVKSEPTQISPRLRAIINNERWHGDGPPVWQQGRGEKRRGAQTQSEAVKINHKLIKRARSYSNEHSNDHVDKHPEALAVGDLLDHCKRGQRCGSGACCPCGRAVQRWFVWSGGELLANLNTEISVVSLVPIDITAGVGQLTAEHVIAKKQRTLRALRKTGITIAVGGIDISANEHENDEYEPYWQLQAWILAPSNEVRAAEPQLRKLFSSSETTPRPVKIQAWNGDLAALAYALKISFDRRVRYYHHADLNGRHGCYNTRDRPLRVEQQLELMTVLDEVGLHARLVLRGARIVMAQNGSSIRLVNTRT